MKILLLVDKLTDGGAERVASLWATGFTQKGYTVGIVLNCPRTKPVTYSIPEVILKWNLWNYTANVLSRHFRIDLFQVRKLSKIISEFNPDVIIAVLPPWAEWARKSKKKKHIPIINTEHNSFERPLESPMSERVRKQKFELNKFYDYITVLTDADIKCIGNKFTHVCTLPNPLTYKPTDMIKDKEKMILAAGRLNAWYVKGFDILVSVWNKLYKKYPEWKLCIAGGGTNTDVEKILSLAEDSLIMSGQFQLLGYQEDMKTLYQKASIFSFPSRFDGFGMALIEAMSQGCAPVACDYKGRQKEIIDSDKVGLICTANDVDAYTEALERMISNNEYRHTVQVNAIEKSKDYSLDKTMNRWEEIVNNVIK